MKMFSFLRLICILFSVLSFGLSLNNRFFERSRLCSFKLRNSKLEMRTLLIDNFDSYTYNIWQLLSEVNGEEPLVVYNNAFNYNWDELLLQLPKFDNIVISPGPGSPDVHSDFGICKEAILRSNLPVLGVCLGHQGIAHSFGATVSRAKVPMHGRLSSIRHSNDGLFHNIGQESKVVRYHSLVVESDTLPAELRATAWTPDGVMMGLEHISKPIYGVQFHPESIATACGKQLFTNFKLLSEKYHQNLKLAAIPESKTESVTHHIINDMIKDTLSSQKRNIIVSKKSFTTNVDMKSVFRELYGKSSASFWLDSSSSGPVQGRADRTTPLSIIGDLDSSASAYAIEYHGSNRITKRRTGQEKTELLNMNIFEYLEQELEINKRISDVIHYSEDSRSPSNTAQPIFTRSEGETALPFNATDAFFGFLGYEARHEATEILTRHYENSYEKYNLSATHAEHFQSSKWVGNLSHPMSFFMRPKQYVVFNHIDNSIYVVSIADNDGGKDSISEAKESSLRLMDRIGAVVEMSNARPVAPSTGSTGSTVAGIQSTNSVLYAVKSKDEYRSDILECLEYIKAGESYEICLTLQFKGTKDTESGVTAEPLDVYESLRSRNPAPYSCFFHYDPLLFMAPTTSTPSSTLSSTHSSISTTTSTTSSDTAESSANLENPILTSSSPDPGSKSRNLDESLSWYLPGGFTICSSSPERYLKSSKDGIIESRPIKGTARRNIEDPELDSAIAKELANDEKSQAENLMVVDLVRNDFGRICEIGSVCVPDLMRVETYASVHQLVSTIRGKLQKDRSLVDAIVATFPGGSMTGAPKLRTMNIIDDIEARPRGIYSGAIGYIGLNGESDLNIVIRTAILAGNTVTVGSGGAIVAMSQPDEEVDEVILKAQAVSIPLGYSLSFGPGDDQLV